MAQHWALPTIGLGLRKPFVNNLIESPVRAIQFLEAAPENWMEVGGARAKQFAHFVEHYPIIAHGLSLSLGGPTPINISFLKRLKTFLDEFNLPFYSEHLSYCGDEGLLYDLLPIPFTEEAVRYVADRIKQVQDILERQIAIENISYYAVPSHNLTESEFIRAIIQESECLMLLDVNNIYVNAHNHGDVASEFLHSLRDVPVAYIHIAGHAPYDDGLCIDTHGEEVIDPVWTLLEQAYSQFGIVPTLLERDSNIPPLEILCEELAHIKNIQANQGR